MARERRETKRAAGGRGTASASTAGEKRIDLKDIPGAQENQVEWMICSGVRTAAQAKKAAKAFISDLERVNKLK